MTDRTAAHPEARPLREPWHTLTPEEVQRRLHSGPSGLEKAEAHRRLARHGANRLAPPPRRGPLLRLLMQFHNILLYEIGRAHV